MPMRLYRLLRPFGVEPDDQSADTAGNPAWVPALPVALNPMTGPEELGEVRDELPADLDRGFVGTYKFPDNTRRRIAGAVCFASGVWAATAALAADATAVLLNEGVTVGGVLLALFGLYQFASGRRFAVNENEALVAAVADVGFAVGHASAQLGWRGWLSRPAWRVLVYSAEDPPTQRGLVLVDALDGSVLERWVEDNPETWISTVVPTTTSVPAAGADSDAAETPPGATDPGAVDNIPEGG